MVKNATSESLEAIPRPMVALGNDYPANYEIAPHRHGRAQLLYSGTGTMTVRTEHGAWVVPPEEGVWIPAGIQHSVEVASENNPPKFDYEAVVLLI
jgi:mannose-6-phosphate isomerase-like protein (cupin superfamily)